MDFLWQSKKVNSKVEADERRRDQEEVENERT